MAVLLFILVFMLVAAALIAPVIYTQTRKRMRDQKNYERGLKMVPLLIHLPPPSEDTENTGRDIRDLVDENISKAQIIYNIIASTLQKSNFKTKIYGQRHFAFEIVGVKGFVYFYAAVPIALVEVVKQAVVSAYPAARLEEVPEHNIFNTVGKLNGTAGGELTLKEPYAYPIATYQDLKRDAMQALLNALSTLDKEDGVGIQILLRPAEPDWRKEALALVGRKRKGKDGKKGLEKVVLGLGKELATALVKPPEAGKGEDKAKNDLSSLEQSILDSMEDKTRHPGYEVLIRVVASSNITQRAQAILNNVVAAFSLFDAPGKNGFKFNATKDIEELTTSYILRMFPQTEKKCILNSVELATIFHFPDQNSIPTSQLERQDSKQVDGPRNIPDKGLLLGYNVFRGVKKPIRLADSDRQRHMYVVGQTGTGKSTFLENLAFQDMLNGGGFAFVDPHGDAAERLLALVPKERTEDIIYFSPADMEYPLGLNLFEYQTADQKDFLIQEVLNMLYKLYDPQRQGIMGPRYEHLFRNAALTVMADPNGGTFVDIPKLFRDPTFVKQKLQYVKDQNVLEFWEKEMPQSQRSNEFGEVVSWFVSKFGAFLSNEMMRNIIGQTKSAFNLREVMDEGKILLVNISKGRLGLLNSQLLGMIFVMKFQAAAMSRANIPESERRDFALYVDEFQNFSTDSFATIMSEARKYHLNLIVANQFTTQLTDEIRDAVFGNVGTVVAFRIGQLDVDALSKYFQPTFDGNDLLRIPNHNTIIRTLVGGVPTQPFSMATLPPFGTPNYQLADALKQLSAAKYGRPKAQVEKEIFERLATQSPPPSSVPPRPGFGQPAPFGSQYPPRSSFGAPPSPYGPPAVGGGMGGGFMPPSTPPVGGGGMGPAPAPAPRTASGTGSFLDDWVAKRDGPFAMRPNPWRKTQAPAAPAPASGFPPVPNGADRMPSTGTPFAPAPPAPFMALPTSTSPASILEETPPAAVAVSTVPSDNHEVVKKPEPDVRHPAEKHKHTVTAEVPKGHKDAGHVHDKPARSAPHKTLDLSKRPHVSYHTGNEPGAAPADDLEQEPGALEALKKLEEKDSKPKPSPRPDSGEIPLKNEKATATEDTIYIDQEGILHSKEAPAASADTEVAK